MNGRSEGLNLLDFLAGGISRRDPVIEAVLSDENGRGATADEADGLARFIDCYTRTDDVRNHRGYGLEMIVKLFAGLRRRISESDGVLLRRFLALTERRGDSIWGNALNMKRVFETYFTDIACYVAENTNRSDSDVLTDGDFERDGSWTLAGGAVFSRDARFSGGRGVSFGGAGGESCSQSADRLVPGGIYALHFFLYGKCGVVVENGGRYWNANEQRFSGDTVLEWVDDEVVNVFESPGAWDNVHCFVALPEDTRGLTVKFAGMEGEPAFVDYARLYPKPPNSSFTLVLRHGGYAFGENTLRLAADGEDPMEGINYEDESYFERAFVTGPFGVSASRTFGAVLDTVRPLGIQTFVEFVGRETEERED